MKFAFRAIAFLMAFQINVRVRANDGAQDPISQPPKCWTKKQGACSVQVGRQVLTLKSAELSLWADQDSLFSREDTDWRFLKGTVRAKSDLTASLRFPYGEVKVSNGEFWILEQPPRFVIRAVRGSMQVQTRDGRELELPEGLEIWVGPVDGSSRQSYGMPALIPVEDHLKKWSRFEPDREKFVTEAKELRTRWQERQEVASALYGEVSKRHLASIEDELQRKKAAERAKIQKREEARKRLYDHAFGR